MRGKWLLVTVILLGLMLGAAAGLGMAQGAGTEGSVAPEALAGTGFTYQGRLNKGGSPYNGTCFLKFSLHDALSGGSQVGITQTIDPPIDVMDGLFTVVLNADSEFGDEAFKGQARWLAVAVQCAGDPGYTTLNPRQALTPAPYALALPGLWTEQNATSPNVIGGYRGNDAPDGVVGATIGGGGQNPFPNEVLADFGTVGGGQGNRVEGEHATIGGGNANLAGGPLAATIGGGESNVASGNRPVVGGGQGNRAEAEHPTVSGGWDNSATGNWSSVGGGRANTASKRYATISGGGVNTAAGVVATVGGGFGNTAAFTATTTSGGIFNSAEAMTATIGGGEYISVTGKAATVGGGSHITVRGNYGVVGGGLNNEVPAPKGTVGGGFGNTASSSYATVGGGERNDAGERGVVAGGSWNTASGSNASVGGGSGNLADGYISTVAGGGSNTASGAWAAVGGGHSNTASGWYGTIPGGQGAVASHYGEMAYASGGFDDVDGSAQTSVYVLRNTSTGNDWTELFLDGLGQRLAIAPNRTLTFDIWIAGRSDGGESAGYHFWGVIENDGGTTAFVGAMWNDLGEDDGQWDARIQDDDANDALVVEVLGNNENIRWIAYVRTVEVQW